jgi:hypothetical protein
MTSLVSPNPQRSQRLGKIVGLEQSTNPVFCLASAADSKIGRNIPGRLKSTGAGNFSEALRIKSLVR